MKLSQYLQYLIDVKTYRLVDLAGRASINISDLSKIVSGKRVCGAKNLAQILGALNEEHRSQALALWLSSVIPDEFQSLVHIVRKDRRIQSEKSKEAPDIKTIEGALVILGQNAETNVALRAVLLNMALAFDKR